MSRAWALSTGNIDFGLQGPSWTGGNIPNWEFRLGSAPLMRFDPSQEKRRWWLWRGPWVNCAEEFLTPHWRAERDARQPGHRKEAGDQVWEFSISESFSGCMWPIEERSEPQRHSSDVCEGAERGLWGLSSCPVCRFTLLLARRQQGRRWEMGRGSEFMAGGWMYVGLISVEDGSRTLLERLSWWTTALVAKRPATLVR